MFEENGSFTDEFREALPGMLGEEHAGSKVFDDIPDISTLAKAYADTKTMVGKKLDNVIQKPAEDASDEDKSNFREALLTELGAPASVEAYQFNRPEMPEGMEYNEEIEGKFKELFLDNKVPVDTAGKLVNSFNQMQIESHKQAVEADNTAFEADATALKADWIGDKLVENTRIALKAVKEFVDDDVKKLIDDAKLYDNASDLSVWRKLGFSPAQLRVWNNIAKRTLSASALKDEGGQNNQGGGSMYPNTDFSK